MNPYGTLAKSAPCAFEAAPVAPRTISGLAPRAPCSNAWNWWLLLPRFKVVPHQWFFLASIDTVLYIRTVVKCFNDLQCIIISIKREHPLASHTSSGRNPSTTAKCSIFNARAISCKLSGEDHHGSFPAPLQKFSLQTKLFDIDVQLLIGFSRKNDSGTMISIDSKITTQLPQPLPAAAVGAPGQCSRPASRLWIFCHDSLWVFPDPVCCSKLISNVQTELMLFNL